MAENRLAYRIMAAAFAFPAAYGAAVFAGGLSERRVRPGLLFVVLLTAACSAGLWLGSSWGRSLALLVTLANAGVGTLQLLAVIVEGRASVLGPAIFLGLNVAAAFLLTRKWFAATPSTAGGRHRKRDR